jgi:hypothetical protein
MSMKKFLLISSVILTSSKVIAGQVSPTPAIDIPHNGTVTASAVVVLQDGTSQAGYRVDCTFQNNGTHPMYYKFEFAGVCPAGSSIGSCTGTVTTADKQLPANGTMNCNNGVTISSTALSILGTAGDTYALTEQFVRGQ